jgi:hypothetical protein
VPNGRIDGAFFRDEADGIDDVGVGQLGVELAPALASNAVY